MLSRQTSVSRTTERLTMLIAVAVAVEVACGPSDDLIDPPLPSNNTTTNSNTATNNSAANNTNTATNNNAAMPRCGDGIVNTPTEECDGGADCSSQCQRLCPAQPIDYSGGPQVAYAWATPSLIDPNHTFNPSGAPIAVEKNGPGNYSVRFERLGNEWGAAGHAQVTPTGSVPAFCTVVDNVLASTFSGTHMVVQVQCYASAGGGPADIGFTVLVAPPFNQSNMLFVRADQPDVDQYAANSEHAFTLSGGAQVFRQTRGRYEVVFSCVSADSGATAQVSTFGTQEARCSLSDVVRDRPGNGTRALVNCVDGRGEPVDSAFNVSLIPPDADFPHGAYARDSSPTTMESDLGGSQSYHAVFPNDRSAIRKRRSFAGNYRLTFRGLNLAERLGGTAQVSSHDERATCSLRGLRSDGLDVLAEVQCYDLNGGFVDAEFNIMVLPRLGARDESDLMNLHWNFSAKDNLASTQPPQQDGFSPAITPLGSILNAYAPPSLGTTPLFQWYSPGRQDHAAQTLPVWHGRPGETRTPDYTYVRKEGYVFDAPLAGTWSLNRWFNASWGDNLSTTLTGWTGEVGDEIINYRLSGTDGYVLPVGEAFSPSDRGRNEAFLEEFGYRRDPIAGRRPLLVVLLEFGDAELTQANEFYEDIVFGPNDENVVDYYTDLSDGRFTWTRAGVIRVSFADSSQKAIFDDPARTGVSFATVLMQRVAAAGFGFARYDSNGDGRVTSDELGVLRIVSTYSAEVRGGGQNQALGTIALSDVTLALQSANCDEQGDIKLFAHELFHQVADRDVDIYGPGRSLNFRASLMAATDFRDSAQAGPVYLDPWHRMAAGWLKPRVATIDETGGVAVLQAAQDPERSDADGRALILYDHARDKAEFFIVEYRTPMTPTQPSGGYDKRVASRGLAVWAVGLTERRVPVISWPGGGLARHNYVISPRGNGVSEFWRAEDGEIAPSYFSGADSGLRLRVSQFDQDAPGTLTVQWHHADQPFAPRLDRLTKTVIAPSESVRVTGVFPVGPATVRAALIANDGGNQIMLDVLQRDSNQLTLRLPSTVERSSYHLVVYGDGSDESRSNGLPCFVR